MGKKIDDLGWVLDALVILEARKDRSRIRMVCDCLKKLAYSKNAETEGLARRLVFLIGKGKKSSSNKTAAIRFLKYVDKVFLVDFLLGAPEGTVRRMKTAVPSKEMERIFSRLEDEDLILSLAKKVSALELRYLFDLRAKSN